MDKKPRNEPANNEEYGAPPGPYLLSVNFCESLKNDNDVQQFFRLMNRGYVYSQGNRDFLDEWFEAEPEQRVTEVLQKVKRLVAECKSPRCYSSIRASSVFQRNARASVLHALQSHGAALTKSDLYRMYDTAADGDYSFKSVVINCLGLNPEIDRQDIEWCRSEMLHNYNNFKNGAEDTVTGCLVSLLYILLTNDISLIVELFDCCCEIDHLRDGLRDPDVAGPRVMTWAAIGTLFESDDGLAEHTAELLVQHLRNATKEFREIACSSVGSQLASYSKYNPQAKALSEWAADHC